MKFEKYFYQKMKELECVNYIPVFWTELQTKPQIEEQKQRLQYLINNLDKDKMYFTVVEHDDGIIVINVPNNVLVFGMGGTGHVPLPLLYENPEMFEDLKRNTKTVFCSFVGSLTHPCREKMVDVMNKPDVVLITDEWSIHITGEKQRLFLELTCQSRFTLAPRGYGKTSFRMYEALRLNSIPVYIYDEQWLPYKEHLDWSKLVVLVHINDMDTLYNRLKRITNEQIIEMIDYYHSVEHYFTYDGMCEYIIDTVNALPDRYIFFPRIRKRTRYLTLFFFAHLDGWKHSFFIVPVDRRIVS
jgi:hypothetical protein